MKKSIIPFIGIQIMFLFTIIKNYIDLLNHNLQIVWLPFMNEPLTFNQITMIYILGIGLCGYIEWSILEE